MTAKKSRIAFRIWAVGLGLALGLGLACGPKASSKKAEGGRAAAPSGSSASAASSSGGSAQAVRQQAATWLGDFTMGHAIGAGGTIPAARQGHDFTPGQTVYAGMEIDHAPAGASVDVAFEDASGKALTRDEKKVPLGATSLYFDSGDTSTWRPGNYRVEISTHGRRVNEQHFNESAPAGAPK